MLKRYALPCCPRKFCFAGEKGWVLVHGVAGTVIAGGGREGGRKRGRERNVRG
jgi:hypothetical protein